MRAFPFSPELTYRICPDRCAIMRSKTRGGGRKRKEKRNEQVQVRDHGERYQNVCNSVSEDAHGSEKARPDAVRREKHNVVVRDQDRLTAGG